jgi:hypothetical protein
MAGAVVVILLAVAGVLVSQHGDDAPSKYVSCPKSAPSACATRLAKTWGSGVHALPSIQAPTGIRYDRGFIAQLDKPASAYFVFDTASAAGAPAIEVTVKVVPSSKVPFDTAHRGGKLQHLAGGRVYLDNSSTTRSGPYIEQVDGFDVVVSFDNGGPTAPHRPAQLALLGSVG